MLIILTKIEKCATMEAWGCAFEQLDGFSTLFKLSICCYLIDKLRYCAMS